MTLSRFLIRIALGLPLTLMAVPDTIRAQDIAIPAQFESASNFHKGVAPAALDKRWGLIDRKGAWVVSPRYAEMGVGGDGLFPVKDEGGWGYINPKGENAIAARFEAAEPFDNGVAAVKSNGRWGYLRTDGSTETEFKFLEIGGREGAYICARDAEGWAVFKLVKDGAPKRESFVDDPPIQRAYSISDGSVIAKYPDGERLYLIDRAYAGPDEPDLFTLTQRFPIWGDTYTLTSILRMSDGFAPASTAANKWGYLHKGSGEFLWAGRFEAALGFAQGLAPVKLSGKWGYIDRAGSVVVQPTYDAAFPFRGEYAVIRQGDRRGFLRLDPVGKISVFITPRYEDTFRFTEGLAPVKIDRRWGYVSDGQPWSELVDTGIIDIQPR